MIEVKIKDHTQAAVAEVRAASFDVIKRMVVFFWQQVQNALNVSNPRPHTTPSRPGEPPRKRTGFGARNVVYDLDPAAQAGRVGLMRNALYMGFLEIGTRRIKPRPWLLATLKKIAPQLRAIAEATKR